MNDRSGSAADAPKMPPRWVFSLFNPVAKGLLAAGVPLGLNGLITVRGRKSGQPRTTPVAIIAVAGRRWVWAPWGDVHWVQNLRAAGRATVTVRRRQEEVRATELDRAQRVAFFRDTLGPLREACRAASGLSAPSTASISTIRRQLPRVGGSSSCTHSGESSRPVAPRVLRSRHPQPPRMASVAATRWASVPSVRRGQ